MSPEKLVRMANQIGDFFSVQPDGKAPAMIADHLHKFWDPRMRRGILEHLEAGGAGLKPDVRAAVELLKAEMAVKD